MEGTQNPKVVLPSVSVSSWMLELDVPSYKAIHYGAPTTPSVGLHRISSGLDETLIAVHFQHRANGVHVTIQSEPEKEQTPFLHIVLQAPDMRKISAGIVAAIALRAVNPKFPTKGRPRDIWFRRMYEKLEKLATQKGGQAFLGIPNCIVDAVRLSRKSYDKAAGLDVDDNIKMLKRCFGILSGHLSEEDIVRIWRETHVQKVMNS